MWSDFSSTSKYPPLTNTILFLILFSINNFLLLCLSEEDFIKYNDCRNLNFTCGDGINIGYPFWGHKRPDYCGIPDYHLDCENNEFTEIEIMSQKYRVLEINPAHRFMTIVRKDFMIDEDSCPKTFINTTLNFTHFEYLQTGFVNLTLSYGCPPLPYNEEAPNNFSCQTNITSKLDANYYWSRNLYPKVVIPDTKQCIGNIDIPISESAISELIDDGTSLNSVLRKGFHVIYGVDEEKSIAECFKCFDSGGACAYNDSISVLRLTCYFIDSPSSFDAPSPVTKPNPSGSTKSRVEKKVAVGVGVGLGGFLTVILVVVFLCYRQRGKSYQRNSSTLIPSRNISSGHSVRPDPENGLLAPIFSYEELEEATNNFDESKELGDGGFGTVYYGELKDGRAVAVKRLYENNCKRVEQFMNEVTILSNLRHKNLVILYGCTSRHSRELLLVYEFVPNGTVADHLHGERAGAGLVSWPIRLNIALESACALTYLHHSDIIHRDVKTNNILLDNNFHVKVADFGLSRLFPTDVTHISTAPQGTPGYVDPDYHQCYQLTDKSDVYSFGVVLIELISSKPAVDINRHRHEINLSNMAINKIHNHALHELVDPSLGFDSDIHVKTMITLVAELAFRCLQQDREIRPSMVEVFEVLKGIQNEGSKMPVAVEMDVPADEIKLMKDTTPISPNSVTQKWSSSSTTPNNSS